MLGSLGDDVSERYPEPPFRTYGSGLAIPCIVPARSVPVPQEFSVVHTAGRTLGMLVYLDYRAPSALVCRELLWLSAVVRCRDRAYRVPHSVGPLYYVAKSYVDSPESVAMGREQWALPRALASFSRTGNRIEVNAADGTHLAFSFKPRNFTFTAPTNVSSLQKGIGQVVCFQARGWAEVQLATYRLESFSSEQPEWESFKSALVLPGVASHIKSFETTLRAPLFVPRRLDSIAPAPSLV
jgi:hypothetical protein